MTIDLKIEYKYPIDMERYKSECINTIHSALSPLADKYSTGILQDLKFDIEETDFNASYSPVEAEEYHEEVIQHVTVMTPPTYYMATSPMGKLELKFLLHVSFRIRHEGTPTDWYSNQILERLTDYNIPFTANTIRWEEDDYNGKWYSQDIILDFSKSIDRDTLSNWVEEYEELNK